MKTEIIVSFFAGDEEAEQLRTVWEANGPGPEIRPGHVEIRRARGDPWVAEVVRVLEACVIPHEIREERTFGAREIEAATALHVVPERSGQVADVEAFELEDACPACDRGRVQCSDLVIDDPETPARGFSLSHEGQILVDEALARRMVEERISGGILRPVRDRQGRAHSVFQLCPIHTLPPALSPPTRVWLDPESRCPICGGGTLFVSSLRYYDLPEHRFADLNLPSEALGAVADGGLVISQRFFRLLQDLGLDGAAVEPVMLL